MDKKSTFIIVGLLSIGILFFLALLFFTREGSNIGGEREGAIPARDWTTAPAARPDAASAKEVTATPESGEGSSRRMTITPKTVVTAKHAYRNGTHIIAGEVPLPTPCHLLEATGAASADRKEVLVEITSSVKTDELCAQVITPARFKVSVKAAQNAKISATLNGQAITLNFIEAGPDEDLDNFELYIKG